MSEQGERTALVSGKAPVLLGSNKPEPLNETTGVTAHYIFTVYLYLLYYIGIELTVFPRTVICSRIL